MTFCWRSTDSRYLACVGFEAIFEVVAACVDCRLRICPFRATMLLSIVAMMAPRSALSWSSMVTTSGFLSDDLADSDLRCSMSLLNSAIWFSMSVSLTPVLAGSTSPVPSWASRYERM